MQMTDIFESTKVKWNILAFVPTQKAGGMPIQSRYCSTMSPAVKQQYLGHTSPMAFLRRRDRTASKAQEWNRA